MAIKNLNVRMPEELLNRVRFAAREERRSMNSEVLFLLEVALRERPLPLTSPEDGGFSGAGQKNV